MKIDIVIPNLDEKSIKADDFQYILGYFEISIGKSAIKLFGSKYCMIFLTLFDLYSLLKKLNDKISEMEKWVGEDNGYSFYISLHENQIVFEGRDYSFNFNMPEFQKSLKNSVKKLRKSLLKLNPIVANAPFYVRLQEYVND